jgi:hypothetical protein
MLHALNNDVWYETDRQFLKFFYKMQFELFDALQNALINYSQNAYLNKL